MSDWFDDFDAIVGTWKGHEAKFDEEGHPVWLGQKVVSSPEELSPDELNLILRRK